VTDTSILIVDDDASIRRLLFETLTEDGHSVVAAENGETALKLLAEQVFDLVLLDLQLPGVRGMEILATVNRQWPETVVIILTGHASLQTAVEALRQGAHDYLFKPCRTIQLRDSIRRGLLKRQQRLRQRQLLQRLEEHMSKGLDEIRATIGPDPATAETTPKPFVGSQSSPDFESGAAEGRFLRWSNLIVDLSKHLIFFEGNTLELSPTEFDVLAYLIGEAPRVVSAQELVRAILGYQAETWEARDVIRQHIHNLRKKIKLATDRTDIIRTVRGVGYAVIG